LVDAVQIQQVLTNLLENAVKFSTSGAPIRLAARVINGELELSVANNGSVIPPNELEKIFARFYRLDSGQSPRPPGTGLGLAICKAIIEAHGGRISAQSRDSETIFMIRLPLTTPMTEQAQRMPLLPLERTS
jgi:signal transduction histidine kinase